MIKTIASETIHVAAGRMAMRMHQPTCASTTVSSITCIPDSPCLLYNNKGLLPKPLRVSQKEKPLFATSVHSGFDVCSRAFFMPSLCRNHAINLVNGTFFKGSARCGVSRQWALSRRSWHVFFFAKFLDTS